MTANRRLHSVLLTLWDIARDNPSYDRKLWGELQVLLSSLETRNNLLSALLADLLHCTDDEGNILWEEASVHSPPNGFAVKFMRDELKRGKRPQMPKPTPVIPVDAFGVAPPPTSNRSDSLTVLDGGMIGSNGSPIGIDSEYHEEDESEEDHLAFEFDLAESDETSS